MTSLFRQMLELARNGQALPAVTDGTGAPEVIITGDIYLYRVQDSALAHGSSFGNDHAWVTSKGTGAIEQLFSTDLGQVVVGSLEIGYFAQYRDLTAEEWFQVETGMPHQPDMLVGLVPLGTGMYYLHPAYQQRHYALIGQLEVLETFFLPRFGESPPCAVYFSSEIHNTAGVPLHLLVNAALNPFGETTPDLIARSAPGRGIIMWSAQHPEQARLLASTPPPDAVSVSHDIDLIANPLGLFDNATSATGRIYTALQHDVVLQPGETRRIDYLVLFHPAGAEAALAQYRALPTAEEALARTIDNYRSILLKADVMTPDTLVNQGAQWSKANMLRVLSSYPTGRAFTNDPGRSSHVVARDIAWYAYGADSFLPEAACDMLNQFAHLQQHNGKIIEYYDARDGQPEDYGLNINDNTPLFVLATAHHIRMTGHHICRERLLEPICRAVDYCLSQRDERGLIFCTATDTAEHGICGWRNIMVDERVSGAVTEINSECYAALQAAAALLEETVPDRAEYYRREAAQLRAAINRYLLNPQTGMYYLTLDVDGTPRTDTSSDLIFPLMFGVADPDVNLQVSERLSRPDMMTPGGMRTVPTSSLNYHPDRLNGLTGGVWPGVTWWYAMGCSATAPGLMVEALKTSYRQFIRNPKIYNTVPGQFSEWFDGESLVNRGMRLSPWEPPRFLWTALEGAFGIDFHPEGLIVDPRVPDDWLWLALRDFPYRGQHYSWFMGKVEGQIIFFTSTPFRTTHRLERYEKDITASIHTAGEHVTMMAWQRGDEILVATGTDSARKVPLVLEIGPDLLPPGHPRTVTIYRSETARWYDIKPQPPTQLQRLAIWVEARGFALIRIYSAQ